MPRINPEVPATDLVSSTDLAVTIECRSRRAGLLSFFLSSVSRKNARGAFGAGKQVYSEGFEPQPLVPKIMMRALVPEHCLGRLIQLLRASVRHIRPDSATTST